MTIGIVADNYKLAKFERELSINGFTEYTITPFTDATSTIKIQVKDSRSKAAIDIKRICEYVELYFKQSN